MRRPSVISQRMTGLSSELTLIGASSVTCFLRRSAGLASRRPRTWIKKKRGAIGRRKTELRNSPRVRRTHSEARKGGFVSVNSTRVGSQPTVSTSLHIIAAPRRLARRNDRSLAHQSLSSRLSGSLFSDLGAPLRGRAFDARCGAKIGRLGHCFLMSTSRRGTKSASRSSSALSPTILFSYPSSWLRQAKCA